METRHKREKGIDRTTSDNRSKQVVILISADYKEHVLRRSEQKLVWDARTGFQMMQLEKDKDCKEKKEKRISIPYAHKIAHKLKNVGSRYGLKVMATEEIPEK